MTLPLILLTAVFCAGYACIVLEQRLGVDKAASALLTGVLCWVIYAQSAPAPVAAQQLHEALGEIAAILFFLLGAMTIVEMIDAYGGFTLITDRIRSRSVPALAWIIGFVAFFLSAALDNLTTTIVMISLCRKLVPDREQRLLFAGLVVIAANAGGAWSPIGDITTTMLWMGGQVSTAGVMRSLFLPSLVCLAVPLAYLSFTLRGQRVLADGTRLTRPAGGPAGHAPGISDRDRNWIFWIGIGGLLSVPVFKTLTGLPPFMGMLLALGVLWVVSEFLHEDRDAALKSGMHVLRILRRIDTPTVLFFLGILVAVSALEATGLLRGAARALESALGSMDLIVFLIGLLSAVVDNVPLVAAVMGMYDLGSYPLDHPMWLYLSFAAGTGGSCLVIGSAAGVAAMGMERIEFFWYLRRIGGLALLGYIAGSAVILLPRLT
jgi:Na+/H+ antiporter NhaD/arsenite permease-like protein